MTDGLGEFIAIRWRFSHEFVHLRKSRFLLTRDFILPRGFLLIICHVFCFLLFTLSFADWIHFSCSSLSTSDSTLNLTLDWKTIGNVFGHIQNYLSMFWERSSKHNQNYLSMFSPGDTERGSEIGGGRNAGNSNRSVGVEADFGLSDISQSIALPAN